MPFPLTTQFISQCPCTDRDSTSTGRVVMLLCAECCRDRYNEFKEKWLLGNMLDDKNPKISGIDKIIHRERIKIGDKVTYHIMLILYAISVGLETA